MAHDLRVMQAAYRPDWDSPPSGFRAPPPRRRRRLRDIPVAVSPIFLGLLGVTVLAGLLTYRGGWPSLIRSLLFFLFVAGGWVVSLSLHEFGHAAIAYWAGDDAVASKGYLTLNPLNYTHVGLSIVLPLLYLAMGGIGLPGGAVYINHHAIHDRTKRSLTSAAGPASSALCALVLLLPFILNVPAVKTGPHVAFWAGIAMLAFLQITGTFFNLLPIPGLDGWGILEPHLPPEVAARARSLGPFTFVLIFLLFLGDTPISRGFWRWIMFFSSLMGLDFGLVSLGLNLFRFWS